MRWLIERQRGGDCAKLMVQSPPLMRGQLAAGFTGRRKCDLWVLCVGVPSLRWSGYLLCEWLLSVRGMSRCCWGVRKEFLGDNSCDLAVAESNEQDGGAEAVSAPRILQPGNLAFDLFRLLAARHVCSELVEVVVRPPLGRGVHTEEESVYSCGMRVLRKAWVSGSVE